MVSEKPLEGLIGVVKGELLGKKLIIVMPGTSIGEMFIGLIDLMEFMGGILSVHGMSVGVPVSGEFLIGLLDLVVGGRGGDF